MKPTAEYIAEADGLVSRYSSIEQAKQAGVNFGRRWAFDMVCWERQFGRQHSDQRRAVHAALVIKIGVVSIGSLTRAFYDAAYSAFCLDAP